jgi:tetratricopeptide (TPR) repeat protein
MPAVSGGAIRAATRRHGGALVLVLLALLGLPSLGGGFLSDDHFVVPGAAGNPLALWGGGLFHLGGAVGAERAQAMDMYRPLALTTVAVDHALYQDRAWGYHLSNALMRLGLCALVLVLLRRTSGRRAALFGALVVGLHPAVAESWLWVSGRFDVLMTAFLVLAWLMLEQDRFGAAFAAALAACLSKEPAVLALAALAVRPRWETEPASVAPLRLRPPRALLALGAAALLAISARLAMLGGLRATAGRPMLAYLRRWAAPWLVDALATIALPRGPSFIEPGEVYNRLSPLAVGAAGGAVLALGLAAWWQRQRWPSLVWGLAAALLLLAPVVPALTVGKGRYLCAPLVFLLPGALALAGGAARALAARLGEGRARLLALSLGGAYLLALTAGLLDATAAFRDEPTLWRSIAEERPDLSMGPGLYGMSLLKQHRPDEAAPLLERARALAADDPRWVDGLALLHFERGDYPGCEQLNRRGAAMAPRDSRFAFGRAMCLRALGDLAAARAEAERGLRLVPDHRGLAALLRELPPP